MIFLHLVVLKKCLSNVSNVDLRYNIDVCVIVLFLKYLRIYIYIQVKISSYFYDGIIKNMRKLFFCFKFCFNIIYNSN